MQLKQNTMKAFEALGISERTLQALAKKGFETPSPIQMKAIPLLLNTDKDVIGQAQTGTGKTAAFGIPIIERVDRKKNYVQALVLAPTRELAMQVADEITSMADDRKLKVLSVYGGSPIGRQMTALENGVHIVVGTPGRVKDLINRGKLVVDELQYAVLDEADEMLNMGFLEEVEDILAATNSDKQILLFSATMPQRILTLAKRIMHEFEIVKVKKQVNTTALIDQIYYQVAGRDFFEVLCRVLEIENDVYGIIFCRTKREVSELNNLLTERGYKTDAIHGDIEQRNREKVIERFKKKIVQILVATDVAARGIDVQSLSHVINYGLPQDIESYVHRIGRTGRAGAEGKAISIINMNDGRKLANIEKSTGNKIVKEKAPSAELMIKIKKERLKHELKDALEKGGFEKYLPFTEEIVELGDTKKIISALLSQFYKSALDVNDYKQIEQTSRRSSESTRKAGAGEVRLFVAFGKKDGFFSASDVLKFITRETKVSARDIQHIKIFDSFSFFNSPKAIGEEIAQHFRKAAKNGRAPLVDFAKEEGGSSKRSKGGGQEGRSGGRGKSKNKSNGGRGHRGKRNQQDDFSNKNKGRRGRKKKKRR